MSGTGARGPLTAERRLAPARYRANGPVVRRPLGPVLRWRMRADTRQALAELRYRVETGHPHPAAAAAPAGTKEPA